MQKTIAISTLQALVSEHNKAIYQEALDCIKKELVEGQNIVIDEMAAVISSFDKTYAVGVPFPTKLGDAINRLRHQCT